MEKQLVSIIMPAYNCAESIELSINSILDQTYTQWELIIVDDGSSDNSVLVIEDFVKIDNRIKLHCNTSNKGVSYTRNFAISKADGEFIAFLDSDDIWMSTKLSDQLKFMDSINSEFSFTGATFFNENKSRYDHYMSVPLERNYKQLLYSNVISTSSVIIKSKFLGDHRMGNDLIHEDYLLWLSILKEGGVANGLDKPLLKYKISSNSKSGNKLKSFGMVYGVHREMEMNPLYSFYYSINHLIRASLKYLNIYRKGSTDEIN